MTFSETPPLRILFVIGSMGGGGAERQVIETLKRLDRQRFCPILYLAHRQGELLGEVPGDVPVHSFWDDFAGTLRSRLHFVLGTTDRARIGHLAQTIRRERVDLVFDHCYLATLDAAVAASQAGVPRISVCVGDPLAEVRQFANGNVEAAFRIARSAYTTADRVIAVSHGIRQRLIEDLRISGDSVVVHFNMLDVDAARRLSLSDDPCFARDRSHVLTVARLSAEKGHRDMLAALELLVRDRGRRELLWHFVGDGPLKVELEADVSSRGLNEYVDFAGFQENPYPFYRHADLFCLASIYEGFGCVLMEALACDLPVVSTDCPSGPREVLDGGKYGTLVPPGDPRALATAIENVLENPEAAREQAMAGREFVARTFSFAAGLTRLEQLFQTVVAEHRRAEFHGPTHR